MTILVSLNIYSGRSAPEWHLDPGDAERLSLLLQGLPPGGHPPGGGLGYHGVLLSFEVAAPWLEATLFEGVVDALRRDGEPELRIDTGRRVERWVLATGLCVHGELIRPILLGLGDPAAGA